MTEVNAAEYRTITLENGTKVIVPVPRPCCKCAVDISTYRGPDGWYCVACWWQKGPR